MVRNWCLETICTVQLTAGKPRFRESKQLRALRRLGYLLKTYEENSFSRARAFTNLRQIGAFGNHLLQLATLRGRESAKDRECPSVGQSECSRSKNTVRFIRICVSESVSCACSLLRTSMTSALFVRTIACHRVTALG